MISEDEFISRVTSLKELSFKPGERVKPDVMDSHDMPYVESGDFCANLHIHTKDSDGMLTVKELIEKTS